MNHSYLINLGDDVVVDRYAERRYTRYESDNTCALRASMARMFLSRSLFALCISFPVILYNNQRNNIIVNYRMADHHFA